MAVASSQAGPVLAGPVFTAIFRTAHAQIVSVCSSVLFVLIRIQSALRVAMSSVLLDGHTWLVNHLSHGGMGSPFDGCC